MKLQAHLRGLLELLRGVRDRLLRDLDLLLGVTDRLLGVAARLAGPHHVRHAAQVHLAMLHADCIHFQMPRWQPLMTCHALKEWRCMLCPRTGCMRGPKSADRLQKQPGRAVSPTTALRHSHL